MKPKCPFCEVDAARVFYQGELVFGIWDAYPVSSGHALLIPRRHFASWFDASDDERQELTRATEIARAAIKARYPEVESFNLGVNVGEAAGQTVPHLHLHVIPRRPGDVPNPRGGVRHVIPAKADYLVARVAQRVDDGTAQSPEHYAEQRESSSAASDALARALDPQSRSASPRSETSGVLRLVPKAPGSAVPASDPLCLLSTGGTRPLLPHLRGDLACADRLDVAVAFVMRSGVERLREYLSDLLARDGELRLLTGDYLDVTDPDALHQLLDLKVSHPRAKVDLRVFVTNGTAFHPKAYLVSRRDGEAVAYVGSSNLSRSALEDGVEWNYRVITSRDREGFAQVASAFEEIFRHPATQALDPEWIEAYRSRRRELPAGDGIADEPGESPAKPPEPNAIQQAALAALEQTRAQGNSAGLVVLATGLGKTFLAAFDSNRPEFRRVLFVAHREEILAQAMDSFRRVRPRATFGNYDGDQKVRDADVVFASIQTLGRKSHLDQFDRRAFDYIVVDEFHHASASTYRRLIEYFEPRFLLGLTATPERTDGGNLLQLCGENLVFRRDVTDGIKAGLLCAFQYFGVPDEVDYTHIPWRSTRFDETALTEAVATQKRAANIHDQWIKHAGPGTRTLAFCVSQRHANFMRDFFRERGVRCAAVHSGAGSDPRAESIEELSRGELQVLFAVDMFNEGVDIPAIDTVMMLRPTESQIVWLQQFGRGLRKHGDKTLTVVDYIGNHRTFLLKARTLLQLSPPVSDRDIDAALERVQRDEFELPPGCSVTYDLRAVEIMRGLLRLPRQGFDALRTYYEDFRERRGSRPTAVEAFHDGYNPRSVRKRYGSWFGFVKAMGDLKEDEEAAIAGAAGFLDALEITQMTKSYKMLVVTAMLNTNTLPDGIRIEVLTAEFRRLAERITRLRSEVGDAIRDEKALRSLIERNPIEAWVGGKGTGGIPMFEYTDGILRFGGEVPTAQREMFRELVRELVDWRLAEYLDREDFDATGSSGFVAKVSSSNGRPILFLPDRKKTPSLPTGWTKVMINGQPCEANFVKVAVNVVRLPGDGGNALTEILRGWFGPDAGLPGTHHQVSFEYVEGELEMRPILQDSRRKLEA